MFRAMSPVPLGACSRIATRTANVPMQTSIPKARKRSDAPSRIPADQLIQPISAAAITPGSGTPDAPPNKNQRLIQTKAPSTHPKPQPQATMIGPHCHARTLQNNPVNEQAPSNGSKWKPFNQLQATFIGIAE